MRQSELFTKTRREAPKDEEAKNAKLLIRAGFINKEMAGIYDYLPLGLRVLKKIEGIIREEMNALGGQEVSMSALQRHELWERGQNRWADDKLPWFKTGLKSGSDLGLAPTHEEPITNMLEQFVSSYQDLPFSVYQFQTKFRNEERAKSGIMRTREFLMKDLYSFSRTQNEHKEFYEKMKTAYRSIFNRVGIGDMTYLTLASGGSFSQYSHEFQTLTEAGEDTIYIKDEKKKEAVNKEVETPAGALEKKAIEVGNIFSLGTKFSDPYLNFHDQAGNKQFVIMGSYGIGLGRLMGTVVEVLSDEHGIVWPKEVAPFQVHLLALSPSKGLSYANEVYKTLISRGIEVLYDDRDLRAGEKFADADLIGIPTQVVIGEKALESKMLEVKNRTTGKMKEMTIEHLIEILRNRA